MSDAKEKYRNDVLFNKLVNVLLDELRKGLFTPAEVSEAAVMSRLVYEKEQESLRRHFKTESCVGTEIPTSDLVNGDSLKIGNACYFKTETGLDLKAFDEVDKQIARHNESVELNQKMKAVCEVAVRKEKKPFEFLGAP